MDNILLRFRDLTQGVNTIDAHNSIVKSNESRHVLWGWWKKEKEPFPSPALSDLAKELGNGNITYIYMMNSDTGVFYRATLHKIYYSPDSKIAAPDYKMCPEYYNKTTQYAWFEMGEISQISFPDLPNLVLSNSNRIDKNSGSIPLSDIGRFLKDLHCNNELVRHPVSMWFLCPPDELGIYTSNYSVSNISHGEYSTHGRYILHLSDIHFGDEHAYKNPCSPFSEIGKEYLIDELLEDLKYLSQDGYLTEKDKKGTTQSIETAKELTDKIGLVLITGDLTWRANPHEFSNAEKFIEELKRNLGLSNQHVVIVPGNHDVEWIPEGGKIDANAELNYKYFYRHIYNCEPNETITKISRYNFAGKKICIIGLNSCRLESQENAGYGYVGSKQLKTVQEYMRKYRGTFDYTIAMLHHHILPVNYVEEYDMTDKKVSMLLDAESVISTLLGCGVNAVLHGHQHQPYFSSIERIIPGYIEDGKRKSLRKNLKVIGAGSVGVKPSHINTIGRNTYNIISIDDENNLHILERIRGESGVGFFSYDEIVL